MKRVIYLFVFICVVTILAADWDPGDPDTKWVQLPDSTGYDVKLSDSLCIADDWQCNESGWICDIHFWISWKGDNIGNLENINV